jgi:hypothetical protein
MARAEGIRAHAEQKAAKTKAWLDAAMLELRDTRRNYMVCSDRPRCLFSSRASLPSLQAPSVRRMRQRMHACLASVQDMRMRLESVMFRLGHRSQTDGAWQRELEMVKGVMHQARAATRRGLAASGTGLGRGKVQVGADPQACPAPEYCRVPRGRVPCADAAGG